MAKKKAAPPNRNIPAQTTRKETVRDEKTFLSRHRDTMIAIMGFYLLILIFFSPVVFQGMGLTPAPDMMAVAGMYKMGEEAVSEFRAPLWNPTLFCGLPMYAGLQYANFTNPMEYPVRLFSFIFGGSHYRIWLFYYLLAGIFAFLLARHFKLGRLASWLVGAGYAFSPQLIVLVDVGHGSKLMGMVYLPLIWLMMDRLRLRPTLGRAAALGAVFAVEILSLHPQVAAYGGMLMGLYLIYFGIAAFLKGEMRGWAKMSALWFGSLALSLAVSAVLWMSVLDYARYSIRGAGASGVAGGGVDWSYATGWSFHPFESITYLFPSWFGFSGGTYWGTVGTPDGTPFTQNPMYFGIVILLLAVFAMAVMKKDRWGFPLTLGLAAWVLSFGKYLPILYGPLFHALPLFNKFRAPVMGQVLLLLPMVLLAGMGLQALFDRIKGRDKSELMVKVILWIAGIAAAKAVIMLIAPGIFNTVYYGIADIVRPATDPRVLGAAVEIARNDSMRVLFFIAVISGLSALAVKGKMHWAALSVVILLAFVVDLWPINRKLVSFQPMAMQSALLQPEGVVRHLSKSKGKYRVHALDKSYPAIYWQRGLGIRSNADPANWLSYFGVESTTGYFGAKPADFQKLMSVSGLDANAPYSWSVLMSRPQLLDALNVRYILTTAPLQMIFDEAQKQGMGTPVRPAREYTAELLPRDIRPGSGAFLYRNPGELPRARLVDKYKVVEDFDQTLNVMMRGNWNPAVEVLLEREPSLKPELGGVSSAKILNYEPETIVIQVETSVPKLLVLADSYYPSGWLATLDGEITEIIRADGVLRAIAIPAGEHKVEFRFRPQWFYTGLYISLLTGLILFGWLIYWIIKGKQRYRE